MTSGYNLNNSYNRMYFSNNEDVKNNYRNARYNAPSLNSFSRNISLESEKPITTHDLEYFISDVYHNTIIDYDTFVQENHSQYPEPFSGQVANTPTPYVQNPSGQDSFNGAMPAIPAPYTPQTGESIFNGQIPNTPAPYIANPNQEVFNGKVPDNGGIFNPNTNGPCPFNGSVPYDGAPFSLYE